MAAIESLSEVLATIVEMIALELKAERGSLFLNDPVTGELYSRAAQGKLAEIYIHRCEQLKTYPPKDSNGIWVMTDK